MGIAGVSYGSTVPYYPHVNSRTGKKAETQNRQSENQSTGSITLNWSDGAIFASGTPDGQSFSIYKTDDYSADNPILNIKGIDKNGNSYEKQINPLTVDLEDASYVEIMAVNAYLVDIGELDANDFSAYERPTEDDLEKADYLSEIRKSRDTQYSVGNMVGYHHGANVCNALVNLQQEQNGTVKYIDGINGQTRVTRIEGRLQSGIIGMSSFGVGDNFRFLEARYADDSTTENPIIEVRISEEFAAPTVFKVNINGIDPNNATQLEMFALCAHADAQGISTADRRGESYMSLIEYAGVGGYEADDIDDFVGKKQNWTQIVSDAQSAELNGTENISDKWTQMLLDLFNVFIENMSDDITDDGSIINLISDEVDTVSEKGDFIQTRVSNLVSESTRCSYPAENPDEEKTWYITCYTEQGITCWGGKKGEMSDQWSIDFTKQEQYQKVLNFLDRFDQDDNLTFANHENFWNDFLAGDIDEDAFADFYEGTNNGIPDYTKVVGDSMFVDKEKVQYAPYFNPIGSNMMSGEEMEAQVRKLIEENKKYLRKL